MGWFAVDRCRYASVCFDVRGNVQEREPVVDGVFGCEVDVGVLLVEVIEEGVSVRYSDDAVDVVNKTFPDARRVYE